MSMLDHLIQQTNITVNLLRQSNVHPHLLAWSHYNGAFDYNATPMVPVGYIVLIHVQVKLRTSWEAHTVEGYYTGTDMHHHRSFSVFTKKLELPESVTQ